MIGLARMNFKTSQEMFEAGYALMTFNIMSDCQNWRFKDENFKTLNIPTVQNSEPNIKLARIEDVRANAL